MVKKLAIGLVTGALLLSVAAPVFASEIDESMWRRAHDNRPVAELVTEGLQIGYDLALSVLNAK